MAKAQAEIAVSSVVNDLLTFLNASPTAFHAVGNLSFSSNGLHLFLVPECIFKFFSRCFFFPFLTTLKREICGNDLGSDVEFSLIADEAKKRLQDAGYEQVSEREDWKLEVGNRYFFTRNHSTIVAFAIGKKYDPPIQ